MARRASRFPAARRYPRTRDNLSRLTPAFPRHTAAEISWYSFKTNPLPSRPLSRFRQVPSRRWRGLRGGAFRAGVVLPAGYPYSEKRMRAASRRPFPPGPLELTNPRLSQEVTRTRFLNCYCRTWNEASRLSTRSQPARPAFGTHGLRRPGSGHFLGLQED